MEKEREERRHPAFARNLQSMKTCAAGAACLLAACLAAACGEVRESRKEREPETRVEDKDEEFERIVREYKDYYVSYTAETDMEVSPLSEIEEEMRRYPKEIKEAKERYALSSPDAVSLVLYKHTPGHKDRYYYRTGLYDDGGMNYIDLNTGRKYVDVDSMPVEYFYDEVFTVDGRTYYGVMLSDDAMDEDDDGRDTVLLESRNIRYW